MTRFQSSVGIRDPLWASFLWVEDGNTGILLVSLDVLNFSEKFAELAAFMSTIDTHINWGKMSRTEKADFLLNSKSVNRILS